jgi:uncharacterized protein (DUF2235 family)
MALYVFDGTGNEDNDGDTHDSNACKFFHAYEDPTGNKNEDPDQKTGSLYVKGIGTRAKTFVGRSFSEAFGIGGHQRVRQAMERLENNIDAGDNVVDIAGFSRGAALALSFANEVAGKLRDQEVRFIGLFDVVGEFGLPGEHVNAGHNLHMPPNALNVFHAMALDETRLLFPLTRLSGSAPAAGVVLQEVWFRGVHSDVGGGNDNTTLNGLALNWIFQNAKRCNLAITESDVLSNLAAIAKPAKLSTHKIDAEVRRRIRDTDLLHSSVVIEAGDRFNNPTVELSRIDDLGTITTPVATAGSGLGGR